MYGSQTLSIQAAWGIAMKVNSIGTLLSILAALLLAPAIAVAAEIQVIQSIGMKEAFIELVPSFEKATGHKVTTTWVGFADIPTRLLAGETFDVVIAAARMIDGLTKQNGIVSGSRVDLARSGVGIVVKAGAPRPDISTTETLKRALLGARSIAYSSGSSGNYLIGLFQRMGIYEKIKPKLKRATSAVPVGTLVASGEAELGFQQVSELIRFPGVDFIGPLPADIQFNTVFSAAIPSRATEPDAAKALIKFLSSPAAAPAIRKMGMDPI